MGDDWLTRYGLTYLDFERFLGRYLRDLDPNDFSDLLQSTLETMTSEIRKAPDRFESGLDVLLFARTVAIRRNIRESARARRVVAMEPQRLAEISVETVEPEGESPKDAILNALAQADETVREVVRLHLEGLQNRAIAKRLGVSDAWVHRRMERAKMLLRETGGDSLRPS